MNENPKNKNKKTKKQKNEKTKTKGTKIVQEGSEVEHIYIVKSGIIAEEEVHGKVQKQYVTHDVIFLRELLFAPSKGMYA